MQLHVSLRVSGPDTDCVCLWRFWFAMDAFTPGLNQRAAIAIVIVYKHSARCHRIHTPTPTQLLIITRLCAEAYTHMLRLVGRPVVSIRILNQRCHA